MEYLLEAVWQIAEDQEYCFATLHDYHLMLMAEIEDGKIGNYANDNLQSDNGNDDDLFPVTTDKYAKQTKQPQRKRSTSLPFIENHNGVYKGLVATSGLQLVKVEESCPSAWTLKERKSDLEFEAEMTDSADKTVTEKGSTGRSSSMPERRSSSMPEFNQFSQFRKNEPSKRYAAKTSSPRQRNKLITEAEAQQQQQERFKLPVISNPVSSQTTKDQTNELEVLNQAALNVKIQRKTYLPRINSNSGSIFMKSR